MRKTILIAGLSCAALGAHAAENHTKAHAHTPTVAATAASAAELPWADAEVRKVDAKAGKLTVRHGRLENLDMAPMTMVFAVKDPAWLQSVKPGDKLRIAVDRVNGVLTVVKLEPAK